jgi:serine/threonine protein kinase
MTGVTASRLGRYELLARLASGGMGEIFLARLEGAAGFEKLVVIKRILPHLADDARFRDMLIGEARIASRLSHPNICQVHELGETDGQLYIVMEYLEGVTLLPLLRKASKDSGHLDFGFIGGVVQQATDALHYAHELRDRTGENLGIVHRDVTPSNLFLTEAGVVKVLDFGIAKVKDASAQTQTGTIKGKYAYMAPEQLRGGGVDRRADVFALGVVIYEMLALRRLFQRKTDYLTFRAVMEQPIADVRRYRADVPAPIAAIVARALDREPANRFDSARQLGSTLVEALAAERRPWSHGEIGDFVRASFGDDLGKRSVQVATAVGSPTPPVLDSTPPDEIDEDDGFPEVDSTDATVAEPAAWLPPPPPFAVDSSPSGANLHALVPAPIAAPRRSLIWPLLAFAMVGIAGGALFLVWKQSQQQPMDVKIISEPAQAPREPAPEPDASTAEPAPPRGSASTPPRKPPPPPKKDPYNEAIRARRAAVNKCAQAHGAPPPGARVEIIITTEGKPKSVQLAPANLNTTPLGGCIRSVFSSAVFPSAKDERKVDFTLTVS